MIYLIKFYHTKHIRKLGKDLKSISIMFLDKKEIDKKTKIKLMSINLILTN